MEELTAQRGHTYCTNTVNTVFGLGSEGGEKGGMKLVGWPKECSIQCSPPRPAPIPFQISRKATKPTICFVGVSLLWKPVKGFSFEYGWIWGKIETVQVGVGIRIEGTMKNIMGEDTELSLAMNGGMWVWVNFEIFKGHGNLILHCGFTYKFCTQMSNAYLPLISYI